MKGSATSLQKVEFNLTVLLKIYEAQMAASVIQQCSIVEQVSSAIPIEAAI